MADEKRQRPPNARFWVWDKAWVKLTLKPGQRLTLMRAWRHEEGWTRVVTCWQYDAEGGENGDEPPHVTVTHYDEGTDCDGPYEHTSHHWCPVERLKDESIECEDAGVRETYPVPAWERVYAHQRDRYAEAMGY